MSNAVERRRRERLRRARAELTAARRFDESLHELAIRLIAERIAQGINDSTLLKELGGRDDLRSNNRWWSQARRRVAEYNQARKIERQLATDPPLSLVQAYARLVGVDFRISLRPNRRLSVIKTTRHIRRRRRCLGQKYGRNTQVPFVF